MVENVNIKHYIKHDRQSSDQNFSSRGHDWQSSEQSNRKLISLHNNGEDEKHAHGFADF
jgi:hypothetical protein